MGMKSTLELPPSVRLATGPGGLPRFEIVSPLAQAQIYLHGGQVTHFAAANQEPLLFMSGQSYFQPGKPIRGGAPIVFPWFGPREGDPAAPAHGLARTRSWEAESAGELPDGTVVVVLRLDPDEASRKWWTDGWVLRQRVTIGTGLTMELEIENTGSEPIRCEEALHTYFRVSDVRNIQVRGLEGAEYLSKIEDQPRKRQDQSPIRFAAEIDRAYVNTGGNCEIVDPGLHRRILIEKSGSDSTVVWNPWIAKARAMADYGDEEWPLMVCVETGNVADNTLEIPPGGRHLSRTHLRADAL